MISGFWSPVPGRGNPADAAVCAGLLQGIRGEGRVLVAGSDGRHKDVDRLLGGRGEAGGEDMGMAALARLAKNNRLPAETVPHYTVGILKEERLDLLPAVRDGGGDYGTWQDEAYKTASRHYDQLYLLLEGGLEAEGTRRMLGLVDHLFICVDQDVHILDSLKAMETAIGSLCPAGRTVLLNPFHEGTRLTASHVARKYGWKKVHSVPFNAAYLDAANQGAAADFVFRQSSCRQEDPNRSWVDAYGTINKWILAEEEKRMKQRGRGL